MLAILFQQIRIHKFSYFKGVWNVLDVLILLICYVCIVFNVYRSVQVGSVLDSLLKSSNQYLEFSSLIDGQTMFDQAIAITSFLSWIKVRI